MNRPSALTLHPATRAPAGEPRPAVLVLPGGGYGALADHEAEPVADWLASLGMHAAVLRYRIAPHRHPAPLDDATEAMTYLRTGDHGLAVDPHAVGVVGFSAGGHLAGALSHATAFGYAASTLPDFAVLAYPVTSMIRQPERASAINLLGADATDAERELHSVDRRVTAATPPTFLWHTADDEVVPVEHALSYASALSDHGVPFALHVFPHGAHGLGLAPDAPGARAWPDLCADWLEATATQIRTARARP